MLPVADYPTYPWNSLFRYFAFFHIVPSPLCLVLTIIGEDLLFSRMVSCEPFTPTQNRITLAEAQSQRPGFARALLQSSKRLQTLCSPRVDVGSLGTKISPIPGQLESSHQPVSSATAPTFSSMRSEQGRIESWRDYFEASLILEREWIEGKPTIKELRGHNEAVLCVKALPQSERIVSGDRLGCIIVWCAITGAFLKEFKHHMMGVSCFIVHDNLLISGSWDGTVIIWKQIPEKPFLKRLKIIDLGEQVMSMDLDDNMDLAIGAVSGIVKVISIKTFSSIETFRSPLPRLCSAVSLSQTKVEAAIGLNYYAWDRTSKAQVGFIGDAHFENISCMKVDVNKRLIFTGSQDSKVRIFSWESKPMLLQQYGGHRGGVRCMTLQDNMIITGSSDKTAMITFRDRNETRRLEKPGLDSLPRQEDTERTTEPVSLSHPTYINSVDSDASMLVTGADDGVATNAIFAEALRASILDLVHIIHVRLNGETRTE
ncbi:hypothetical protein BGZ80_000396 [Entomortierella chlamydospora]|uniref:Uncharacterized protein n=1 Tax=Entomortierella chlamydospora TaxID=101097 RepID=A0A9P6T458_9FUNG|nr:hypothetical protein BGZ80_000396 [Entomortierella chlamydospora]